MIEVTRTGDVFVLTMIAGENRYNPTMLGALEQGLDEVEASEGAAAVVLTGQGKFFSNGLDLDWIGSIPDGVGFIADVHRLFGRLLVFPGYLVGALNGHCFAAGAMLSLTLDTRVMRTDRGFWCLPEADLALPLTHEMATAVTAKLPRTTAHEAIVTGRRYTATDAHAAGIVEHTASEADVVSRAVELAGFMAHKDRRTLAAHKQWLYGDAAEICGFSS